MRQRSPAHLVLTVGFVLLVGLGGCTRPADPLGLSGGGDAIGTSMTAGQEVIFWTRVANDTDYDVTLLDARPIPLLQIDDGPHLVATHVMDAAMQNVILARLGEDVVYPPGVLQPLEGSVVEAGQTRVVGVQLAVDSAGAYGYEGVVIDYLYAGRVFSPLNGLHLVLCADQPADCFDRMQESF